MKTIFRHMLLYGLLGPLIGAVVSTFGLMFFVPEDVSITPQVVLTKIITFPFLLLFAIPIGYIVGGAQALFVGLVSGVAKLRWQSTAVWIPLAASCVAWAAYVLFVMVVGTAEQDYFLSGSALGILVLQIFSALVVWFVAAQSRKRRVA